MTPGQVAALFGVWVIAVISPGPDLVVVLQRALAGRSHGVATAVGVVAGIAVWLVAAFAGLAAVVRVYPAVMSGLQVAGGALLAALGVLGLRGWWRARSAIRGDEVPGAAGRTDAAARGPAIGPAGDVARGLATNLANPKALVFFGAVLTPFLRGAVPTGQSVGVVAGMIAVALLWFCGIAVVASQRGVNERVSRVLPAVDVVVSTLFVAVGVAFVLDAAAGAGGG